MILYTVLAELDGILAETASLVDLYKNKELSFYDKSMKWLERLEKLADENRWVIKAEIASLRGRIITASRMQADDTFSWMPMSKNRRRAKDALTAECINIAVSRSVDFVQKDRELQNEAANILRQVLSVAISKGLVEPRPSAAVDSSFITHSWRAAASDQELAKMCAHVVGLIGAYNAYILFDKAFGDIFINGHC
ncbi:MAG: hypothetical protein FWF18_00110 [Dehalococcoidia bacterium]|nr:hypothetical protein [Dehalococcoidia bacterium]